MSINSIFSPSSYTMVEVNGEVVSQSKAKKIVVESVPNILIRIREKIADTASEVEQIIVQIDDDSLSILVYRDPTSLMGGWNWSVMFFNFEKQIETYRRLLRDFPHEEKRYIMKYHDMA